MGVQRGGTPELVELMGGQQSPAKARSFRRRPSTMSDTTVGDDECVMDRPLASLGTHNTAARCVAHHRLSSPPPRPLQPPSLREEWDSALLLTVLYMIQGIPLGLSMGSM